MYDVLIQNGLLVTENGLSAEDIAIAGEKIAARGPAGTLGPTRTVIDAGGKYILPGLIDPHVHIHHPFKGSYAADDFYSATVSAAFGGDTMVCDFAIQWDKEKDIVQTCDNRKAQFEGQSVIDFAYHACPTLAESETIEGLETLIERDIPSVKLYMTYSRQGRMSNDAILLETLKLTARKGGIVGVHAENDALCNYYADQFSREGRSLPHDFPLCKQNLVESEAVNRAIYFAKMTGGTLYIFHLTCAESLELVRKARAEGVRVFAETCTHYLTMDMSKYDRPDGANLICSPPLRKAEDVEALWGGINDGSIGIVSSDHCGFTKASKELGGNDFTKTPNGLPGMELRLPAIYTYGVKTGRIDMMKLAALLSTNPAKVFGMYPRKGCLNVGSDADIVIFDPSVERYISPEALHSPVDWSPFDGETLYGEAQTVFLRGNAIISENKLNAEAGCGRFTARNCRHIVLP